MTIVVNDQGLRNRCTVDASAATGRSYRVVVQGDDNVLEIGPGSRLAGGRLEIRGNRCHVRIGANCSLRGDLVLLADETALHIGSRTTSMGVRILLHERGTVVLGEDCMISGDVRIDVSDAHSILDATTRKRINPPGDVIVEDHVWIGFGAMIGKGVRIGRDAIVGARALVSRDVPAGCVVAGVPARVVREGVTWDRRRLPID